MRPEGVRIDNKSIRIHRTQLVASVHKCESPQMGALSIWWPGAESNHRHADFQFAYKTVSYGNVREFQETRAVGKINRKALTNKRLGT